MCQIKSTFLHFAMFIYMLILRLKGTLESVPPTVWKCLHTLMIHEQEAAQVIAAFVVKVSVWVKVLKKILLKSKQWKEERN